MENNQADVIIPLRKFFADRKLTTVWDKLSRSGRSATIWTHRNGQAKKERHPWQRWTSTGEIQATKFGLVYNLDGICTISAAKNGLQLGER